MPVTTSIPIRPLSQEHFGELAYEVVGKAFEIHDELGCAFHESAYRSTMKEAFGERATEEVMITLTHRDFQKDLFVDLVVDGAGLFELKAANGLHANHESQLIQYLMLTDSSHGKLINFGSDKVEHRFVNCHERSDSRRQFKTERKDWRGNVCERFEHCVTPLVHDWGTGLTQSVYSQAIAFLLRIDCTEKFVQTTWRGKAVSRQDTDLIDETTGFAITCMRRGLTTHLKHLQKFLNNTSLQSILWANIASGCVTLQTISE